MRRPRASPSVARSARTNVSTSVGRPAVDHARATARGHGAGHPRAGAGTARDRDEAVVRDRSARAARADAGRQRPVGLHAAARRRDRRRGDEARRPRGDRDLASPLLLDDGRVGATRSAPGVHPRRRPRVGHAADAATRALGGRTRERCRARAAAARGPLRRRRRCCTGPAAGGRGALLAATSSRWSRTAGG